ncbi:MAG TPA: acyl-ACP--UDP-N-acetylglucosamine O-acyltransferase [Gemmatimonadaceae bacterium]|jgi:UDP-N-acetylglucosamine acyltransferase|nr:acyl-ACP--UDP-N-acetylglucosamine O-acyltransferase [Gemmatimonadaceae bacterium]
MTARIHPTALVSSRAELASDVEVGAYAIIGDNCTVASGCIIAPRATLERNVALSANVQVGMGTILGGPPQDLKFAGEETTVEIGEGTVIREYTTINRGTSQSFKTTVGRNCLLMSYVHLAHDCHIGDNVILSNVAQLAGHVTVEDRAIVSGLSAVHQFVRIGRQSFIGGCSRVSKDIPPFLKAVGNPVKLYGLNTVGLQRSGMDESTIRELKRAYRLLFRSDLNVTQAIERAQEEIEGLPEVRELIQFVEASERGVVI